MSSTPMTRRFQSLAKRFAPLAILALLQIADVLSTGNALATPGVVEANPLAAWCQQALGAVWWLPKLAIIVFLAAIVWRLPTVRFRGLWLVLVVLYAAIVANNIGLWL